MIAITYPISGDYRFPMLILEWLFAILCFEFGVMFIAKYFKFREKYNMQDIGFCALNFGLAIAWFFQIICDYFIEGTAVLSFGLSEQVPLRALIWGTGFYGFILGDLIFFLLVEKHVVYFKKYFFSKLDALCICLYVVFYIWDVEIVQIYSIVINFLLLSFAVIFLGDLSHKIQPSVRSKQRTLVFFSSISIFGLGSFLKLDLGLLNLGYETRLVGIWLILCSFLLFSIFLLHLPPVALWEWKGSLEEVFLINKSGICLFGKSFITQTRALDDNLITSALTSVNLLIQEMVAANDQGLSKVKQEKKVVFIFSATIVNGAAICNQDHPAISAKLKRLVLHFEELYGGIIPDWNGDGSVFDPVETIIEEILSN